MLWVSVPAAQLREARLAQGFTPFKVFVIVDFPACVALIEDAACRTGTLAGVRPSPRARLTLAQTSTARPAMSRTDYASIHGHMNPMGLHP